ncbi:hypothetical protein HNY73_006646 [Argiope bruennichi]|uniref:Uncharacterized protein n=1 Tax=Argiope bruennichi TaxID=94029 RepID=A0A8T0FBH1_ARGBR|nr:hypothetical protein HNY73_006646 [Argiope bruennichi]
MDHSDLSLSSCEDNSSPTEKSKSDDEGNTFPIRVDQNSNKDDPSQEKYETEDSAAVAWASVKSDQSETRKRHASESPIGVGGKRASYKISPRIRPISKLNQSTTSTEANFGSSSSNGMSSEEELLDNLEEIYESEDSSDLAHKISERPPSDVENESNSTFITSFAGIDIVDESQTSRVFSGADETSSHQEDSSKTPEMPTNLHTDSVSPTTKSSSNYSETNEMHFTRTLASGRSLEIEKSPSNMNATILSLKPSSEAMRRIGHSLLRIAKMVESFHTEVENKSHSPSPASFAGKDVINEPQTTHHAFTEADESSSHQEDSLKPPEMPTNLHADNVSSPAMESPSNFSETDEMHFIKAVASSESSETETRLSNMVSLKSSYQDMRRTGHLLLKLSKKFESFHTEVKNKSDSPSAAASFSGKDVINESQTTHHAFNDADESSSHKEDSLKLSEMPTNFHADSVPPTTESSSNYSETDEMHFTKTLASGESLEIEISHSNMNETTLSLNSSSQAMTRIGHSLLRIAKMVESLLTETQNKSDSPSTTFAGTDMGNESNTNRVFTSSDESSSHQEDSPKTPEMPTNLHADNVSSPTMESPSNFSETDEMHFMKALASVESSETDKQLSNMVSLKSSSQDMSRIGHLLLKISKMVESFPTEVENKSDSPSATSFADTDVIIESQTTHHAFTEADESSSLKEDSLKPTEMPTNLHADNVSSPAMESPSNYSRTKEMQITGTLASTGSSEIESMMTITLPKHASSTNSRVSEMPPALSDCGATGGFYEYDLKNDKSVRRKIKAGTPVMSDANLPPTKYSAEADSPGSRRVGRSLLRMSRTMEDISTGADDRNIFDTYRRYNIAENFASKTWMKELLNFCTQTENNNETVQFDTQSLLEEVHHFFQRNPVTADESLNWEESKRRIITSKYFSDEFARDHGLLPFEELMEKYAVELENYASSYLKNQLIRMQALCKILIQYNLSERNLIDYCEDCSLFSLNRMGCISSDQRSSLNQDIKRRLLWIAEEMGWDIFLDLYKKVSTGEASFVGILRDSEISPASIAEETFPPRESPNPLQSSNHAPDLSLACQSTDCTKLGTPLEDKSGNIEPPSGNERNLPKQDESTSESKESSNFISESDSQTIEGNQQSNENIPLSTSETTEPSNGENAGEGGSNVSAQNFES